MSDLTRALRAVAATLDVASHALDAQDAILGSGTIMRMRHEVDELLRASESADADE